MNLRATTPASFSRTTKGVIIAVVAVLLILISVPFVRSHFAAADQYDDKIAALQRDMARYRNESERLNGEAVTLQNTVAKLANEREALQAQIKLNQSQYNKLVKQITETEAEIGQNQDALGTTLADLYVDSGTTPIELLASSSNISDFINKQEYRTSIRDQLGATIEKVKTLKAKLDTQKADVSKVLAKQKDARKDLVAKENEQQRLLSQTQNNEAAYQKLIKSSKQQIAEARATQAALNSRVNQGGGMTLVDAGSLGDYPWDSSNCYVDVNAVSHGGAQPRNTGGDRNDFPYYGCRQCTSYVAWKIAQETGRYYWDWGNGGSFANSAIGNGYQDLGHTPKKDSIAVMWGNPGHVAWVEDVLDGGAKVLITQYNYNYGSGWGMYSKVIWPTSTFDQYVKIK